MTVAERPVAGSGTRPANVALEIAARRRGGTTFGDALAALLRPWPARVVVVAAWLWLGWHVFVRTDGR